MEESFDGVLVHDGKKVQFANSRFCEMLGYRKEELEGMDVELTLHPDDRHLVKKRVIARIRGEDVPSLYELKLQRKDGAALEVETNARAVVLEGRTVLQSWIRDISERKQAEEALQRSAANYRAIFDSMNDAIFVHDIETGAVIDVNRKMCEMYGYTREEATRLVAGEMSFGNDKHSRELALQRIAMAARGEPQLFEWQAKAKDGRLFWVEVNLRKAILNDNPYVLAVVRDITDRKRAEAERENERQKFQTLVDDAPFGIVMIRKDNTYEYVNPKFTEMFGYDLNDIPAGKHWLEKSWPDPEYRREVAEAWITDVPGMEQGVMKVRTFAITCADGIQKMITLRSAQLHTGEFILTCEDITEQIRGEQERENLRQQLLHAQKMEALGTLVGGIAHDFNNLLTIILGYSELLLLEKGEDDPGKADLQKIIDAGSSGAALVQRMLTFSEQTESVLGPLNLNR